MDFDKKALELHKKNSGKIAIKSKIKLSKKALSLTYTPGVAAVSRAIAQNPSAAWEYTMKKNTIAVVTDGSAVLGLGNVGPYAALPVMEGKCMLFKELGGVDAFPICIATQDTEEIIKFIRQLAPVFGGINIEDIAAPKCFEIEARLQDLGIPVMHDDQHATAVVIQAALQNAAKVVKKKIQDLKVVINGAGAAGLSTAKMLRCINIDKKICTSVADIIICDSKGIIFKGRGDLNDYKKELAENTNRENKRGTLEDALSGADVFIGLSVAGVLTEEMIRKMNKDPIVFAMADPMPEIMPAAARKAGAAVLGSGRSDFPNQINNVLAFPGIFRGALDAGAVKITPEMRVAAAQALAKSVRPTANKILPHPLEKKYVKAIAKAVADVAREQKVTRQ